MIARRIMILSGVVVAACAYFIFFKDRDDLIILFSIALIIFMITYVFQHQLDQLMTRGAPQAIPQAMRNMLMGTAVHFTHMPLAQRQMMEDRMQRWIVRKEFINQNKQDAPEDVKYILAYYAALLTIHQQSYLYEMLDRIVFYHHPFLTPAFPDDVHIIEVEPVDGTIIISVADMLKGHFEKGYYNLGLHGTAEAYKINYMKEILVWEEDVWEKLEEVSGISKLKLETYLGVQLTDPWPVAVHHQLMYKNARFDNVLQVLPQFNN